MALVPRNISSQAFPRYDRGAVDPSLPVPYVILLTTRTEAQQAELQKLLAAQQDRFSPSYHRWLTPERFAESFGLNPARPMRRASPISWLRASR